LRPGYYDLALVVERATYAMSTAITPRRVLRDRFLLPVNDWRGRRTGWIPPPWGTVNVDEQGIEDMVEFFKEPEPREEKFKYQVKGQALLVEFFKEPESREEIPYRVNGQALLLIGGVQSSGRFCW
jgi:hypothetical protein